MDRAFADRNYLPHEEEMADGIARCLNLAHNANSGAATSMAAKRSLARCIIIRETFAEDAALVCPLRANPPFLTCDAPGFRMPAPYAVNLEAILIQPREELDCEIKTWLELSDNGARATLAKAIVAVANHGGGIIIIGFAQQADGTFAPDPARPATLAAFSQDTINGIVQSYAEPSFHCSVHHVIRSNTQDAFPVIVVPGGHPAPIQARKGSPDQRTLLNGRCYIRRPGPESAEPQTAAEWRELFNRCLRANRDDLLNAMRDILAGRPVASESPPEPGDRDKLKIWSDAGLARWRTLTNKLPKDAPGRLLQGHYRIAASIIGDLSHPSFSDLLELIRRSSPRVTGWSPWWVPAREGIAPYVRDNAIECFLGAPDGRTFEDPAHSDFWRISPDGQLFLIRGYEEDSVPDKYRAGTVFDVCVPTWRAGEALLFIEALARNLGAEGSDVLFTMRWTGLAGRELVSVGNPNRILFDGRRARQDTIDRELRMSVAKISDTLPELVHTLLEPLYELFDFFGLPAKLVGEELTAMRGRRF